MSLHLDRDGDAARAGGGVDDGLERRVDRRVEDRGRWRRVAGWQGGSLVAHAAVIAALSWLASHSPSPAPTDAADDRPATETRLVWLQAPGAGGGGGGGGQRSPLPPRRMETPGADRIAVPVVRADSLTVPDRVVPPRAQEPPRFEHVPVRRMDAGELTAMGVITTDLAGPPIPRGPGSGGGAGGPNGSGSGPDAGRGLGPGRDDGIGEGVFELGSGVEPPQLVRHVRPTYTPEAIHARVQGEVWVSAIVQPDGTVSGLKVQRSLDAVFGLDEEALRAVRQWKFRPGRRGGRAVAVRVSIGVDFTMR